MSPNEMTVPQRILYCIAFGVALATLFSVWVAVITVLGSGAVEKAGFSLATMVATYYLGGLVGGLIVGVFWPLTQNVVGAALVGYVAALPFYVWVGAVVVDGGRSSPGYWPIVLISSTTGAAMGVWLWRDWGPKRGR